jgi:4-hydroxy-2-oxoheptanedioate aldolase
MLETREAFEHARSIDAVPGIDGVFVGPSDLALSLGLQPGDVLHTEVRRRCTELAELCSEFGVVAAIGSHTLDQARTWLAAGFQMLSIGRDLTMMTDRMGERLAQLRGA